MMFPVSMENTYLWLVSSTIGYGITDAIHLFRIFWLEVDALALVVSVVSIAIVTVSGLHGNVSPAQQVSTGPTKKEHQCSIILVPEMR